MKKSQGQTCKNPGVELLKMATGVIARRAPSTLGEASAILRSSFSFIRNLSTTAPISNPAENAAAAGGEAKKPKRKKKKNLFEVAQFLPNWGIGYHMAKTHWTGVSYEITKINLYKVIVRFPYCSYICVLLIIFDLSLFLVVRLQQFLMGCLQDGRHGKAWGIAHKEGNEFPFLVKLGLGTVTFMLFYFG